MRWSYSKFSKAEQCGLAYQRHYVLGERGPSSDPLRKGSLVHATLEAVARAAVAKRYTGPLDQGKILALYAKLWSDHYPDGGSAAHFADGEGIVAKWVDDTQSIDYRRIEAIEHEFNLPLPSGDTLIGFIDIVERDTDGRLVVKDYKTNRAIYTRDEVSDSMQLGIYAMAAAAKWPGEPVRLCYDMLRHGFKQYTERTPPQLATLGRYLGTLARRVALWEDQADTAGAYPATLNRLCGWCHHREMCPEYGRAMDMGELGAIDPQDWDAMAKERERMASVEKAARARRGEIDVMIRARCKEDGPLVAGGRVYRLAKTARRTHQPAKVAKLLADALGNTPEHWLPRIAAVSTEKLKRVISSADVDQSAKVVLRSRVDAVASESISATIRSSVAKEG